MSFIDNTYFINDISAPDKTLDNFGSVITRYEPEILKDLLGVELYNLLIADLDGSGLPQTKRFKDLVDGAAFSFELCGDTITEEWGGFVNDEKVSLISYYVYYKYRNDTESFFSGSGQVESLTENASRSDVTPRLVYSWNEMLCLYGNQKSIDDECYHNYFYYPISWRDNSNYVHYNAEPSAYNFLLANLGDYPEWIFKPKLTQNQFEI